MSPSWPEERYGCGEWSLMRDGSLPSATITPYMGLSNLERVMKKALLFCSFIVAAPAVADAATQAAPTPPAAQSTPSVTVGATVNDTSGAQVGTVDQVNGDVVIVNTGTNKVGVPLRSFANGPTGLLLGLTKAELDAAAQQSAAQSKAQLQSLLVAGTPVHGTGGTVLGTVKAADDQNVTVTTDKGEVRLPTSGFAARPEGLVVGITAAQLEAAVSATKAR